MRRALIAFLLSLGMIVSAAPAASAGPWETIWCTQDAIFAGEPQEAGECSAWN